MDKFISISVNQGDAFFLKREGKNILVDGGISTQGFANQFKRVVGIDRVDVMVCTHADADHINGLIGYFQSGLKANEVWLPGKWSSRLNDLISRPSDFFTELYNQINDLTIEKNSRLENLNLEQIIVTKSENKSDIDSSEEINSVFNQIDDFISSDFLNHFRKFNLRVYCNRYFQSLYPNFNVLFDAIEVAMKIRELSILAFHSGAKVRWFESNSSVPPSPGESYLKPVNSKEIFSIPLRISALNYLFLSQSNKESLVFYSPSASSKADVLFSADSDFSFTQPLLLQSNRSLITAPHHGSENNKNAYERLEKVNLISPETTFIRSDGNFKKRPGTTYKSLKAKKYCTLCQNPNHQKLDIIFEENNGWHTTDKKCDCL